MNTNKFSTVPNQRIFCIHRSPTDKNFISINKLNFTKAYRDMSNSPAALGLYLWLVGNKNDYKFAFSPQAIENQLGMANSSCHGAVKKLEELGYLVKRNENSNVYDFYEVTTLDGKLVRKPISEEMLIFDEMSVSAEPQEQIPLAKHGDFTF